MALIDVNGLKSVVNALKQLLNSNIENEATQRQLVDVDLQQQIDAITVSSDVRDVVGTYEELEEYSDTHHMIIGDIVKVLEDETQDDAISYYRWTNELKFEYNDTTNTVTFNYGYVPTSGEEITISYDGEVQLTFTSDGSSICQLPTTPEDADSIIIISNTARWGYIGSQGPFYTKSETDRDFQKKLTAGEGINIDSNNVISTLFTSVRTVFTPEKEIYLTSEINSDIYDVADAFTLRYSDFNITKDIPVGKGAILLFDNLTAGNFRALIIGVNNIHEHPSYAYIYGKPDADGEWEEINLTELPNDLRVEFNSVYNEIANKQDELIAGSNISIVNNVISAVLDLTNYYTKTETNTLLDSKADTSALGTKLDINQGSANVGKVMTVGADGSLTPQLAQGTTYTAGQNISISAQNVISAGIEVIEL